MTADPWAVNAPTPPDREAQFAALLSHYHALDDSARSHIMTAHQAAVMAAVTAVLDSLATEFDKTGREVSSDDPSFMPAIVATVAFEIAAKVVRERIAVPFR